MFMPVFRIDPFLLPFYVWLWRMIKKKLTPIKGRHLVITGPPSSGKTYLYCKLRGVKYDNYEETAEEKYKGFVYTKRDGSKIRIADGIDFGGSNDYKKLVRESIEQCDCVMMLFDIRKYISDNNYKKEVKSSLDLIWVALQRNNPQASVSVLMTHADQLSKDETKNAQKTFKKDIAGKPYEKMIIWENVIPVNLTDDSMLRDVIDNLF